MNAIDFQASRELREMADTLNRHAITVAELFVEGAADRDQLEAALVVARAARQAFVNSVFNREAA